MLNLSFHELFHVLLGVLILGQTMYLCLFLTFVVGCRFYIIYKVHVFVRVGCENRLILVVRVVRVW